ncbi:hypothetical protein Z517_02699 [Fonsecaea pedrosoi CBS 271.37]|uniref:Uncharacterized protein n=1 Tax=Fonsecaea pedrosoi CBS 271.37 TaxID=1442368 RepID=A0A0D2HGA5_9EURO|nr:uncharacterized protein Z517_02699 [Fonsecaea pedrosoi CBS 271.37]KIW83454.1 hypothetical protein Z517_02699 [Fonsecaea pedrosoi CBS 271.37]
MEYSKSRYAFQPTSSSPSSSSYSHPHSRQIAYQIGTLSRSKIQKEAAKTAPHLHRLLGHAAVYDNAARYIIKHMHDYTPEIERSPSLGSVEEIEDVDDDFSLDDSLDDIVDIVPEDDDDDVESSATTHESLLQTAQVASFKGYAQLKSPRLCGVVVTTTPLVAGAGDGHWEEVESDASSTETESDDDFDLDSDLEGDLQYDYYDPSAIESASQYRHYYERHSDWRDAHSCSKESSYNYSPSAPTAYTYTYTHSDDDQQLWSQQPRVWSREQETRLFVEAFG